MLVVETIARIRREHLGKGVPIRKLVRDLKVARNTVRKVVRSDETSAVYERKVQPRPKLGPWIAELDRRLEVNEKKPRRGPPVDDADLRGSCVAGLRRRL